MDTNNENWGVKEWRVYALFLEKVHQKALDGWAASVDELEQHSKLLRQYVELASHLYKQVEFLSGQQVTEEETSVPTKKKRGRPRKNPAGISNMELFESMKADYLKENPNTNPSDRGVIKWGFSQSLKRLGVPLTAARMEKLKSKVKTFQTRLIEEKYPTLPKKSR